VGALIDRAIPSIHEILGLITDSGGKEKKQKEKRGSGET
jgi:hypothetical protein